MKKYFLLSLTFLIVHFSFTQTKVEERCGTEMMEQNYIAQHPNYKIELQEQNEFIKHLIAEDNNHANLRNDLIQIPVVVHVVWHEPSENISDYQIRSQIEILNRDFQMRNEDHLLVSGVFQDLVADIGFEFCLAAKDPSGNLTNGITRTFTDYENIGITPDDTGAIRVFQTELGGKSAWDQSAYLNIWIANTGTLFNGRATAPNGPKPEEDGVLIHPHFFGGTCFTPYHLGRTATHEIGHYFGLEHPWKGACNDPDGDFIDDTPAQKTPYSGCLSTTTRSCGSRDLTVNFMQYVDDPCMYMFTKDQKDWMHMNLQTYRHGLLENPEICSGYTLSVINEIKTYPNPVDDCIYIDFELVVKENEKVRVLLINTAGQIIYEAIHEQRMVMPISVSNLSDGIYFLNFQIDKKSIVKKILIRH